MLGQLELTGLSISRQVVGLSSALQLQIRQIAEKPGRDTIDGWLKLWSQSYCLTEIGLSEFLGDARLALSQSELKDIIG